MWAESDLDICKKKMLEDISSKLATVKVDERDRAVDFRHMLPAELHVVTVERGARRDNHVHEKMRLSVLWVGMGNVRLLQNAMPKGLLLKITCQYVN